MSLKENNRLMRIFIKCGNDEYHEIVIDLKYDDIHNLENYYHVLYKLSGSEVCKKLADIKRWIYRGSKIRIYLEYDDEEYICYMLGNVAPIIEIRDKIGLIDRPYVEHLPYFEYMYDKYLGSKK
jgi:hypothetical protein